MGELLETAKKAGNAVLDAGENFQQNEMQANSRGRITKLQVTRVTDQFGQKAWAIKKNGVIFDDSFNTKDAAVGIAQSMGDDLSPAKLVIEYSDGSVQDTRTY